MNFGLQISDAKFVLMGLIMFLKFKNLLHFSDLLGKLGNFFLIGLYLLKIIPFLLFKLLNSWLLMNFINWSVITHIFDDLVFLFQFLLQILNSIHIGSVKFALSAIEIFFLVTVLYFCCLLLALLQLLFYTLYPLLCEKS